MTYLPYKQSHTHFNTCIPSTTNRAKVARFPLAEYYTFLTGSRKNKHFFFAAPFRFLFRRFIFFYPYLLPAFFFALPHKMASLVRRAHMWMFGLGWGAVKLNYGQTYAQNLPHRHTTQRVITVTRDSLGKRGPSKEGSPQNRMQLSVSGTWSSDRQCYNNHFPPRERERSRKSFFRWVVQKCSDLGRLDLHRE